MAPTKESERRSYLFDAEAVPLSLTHTLSLSHTHTLSSSLSLSLSLPLSPSLICEGLYVYVKYSRGVELRGYGAGCPDDDGAHQGERAPLLSL